MAAAVSVGLREQQQHQPPSANMTTPVKFPQLNGDNQEKLMEVLNEKPSSSSRKSLDKSRRSFATEDSSSSLSSRKSVDLPRAAISDYRRSKRISTPTSPSYPPTSRHPSSNHRTYMLSGGSSPQLVDTPLFGSTSLPAPTTPHTPSALSKSGGDRHASSSGRRSMDGNGRRSARTSGDRSSADEGLPMRKQASEDSSLGLENAGHTRGVSMQKPKTAASEHPLLYHKLEMASLSTPELHLASDPMISTEEPTYRQRMSIQLLRSARAGSRERRTSTEVPRGSNAEGGFASFTSMMDQVQTSFSNVGQRMRKDSNAARVPSSGSFASAGGKGSERERKASAATIVRTTSTRRSKNAEVSVEGQGQGTTSSRGSNGTAFGTNKSKQKLSNNGLSNALSNASTWLKRPRRWSTQNGRAGPSADARKASAADPQGSSQQVVKALSSETNGDVTTVEGVDAQFDLAQAKEKLRAARQYLITELGKIEDSLIAQDKTRVASLQWSGGEEVSEEQWADEQLHLWKALSDGVLLCLLADKFCPGSIEKIDRRDVEWVKADNISRFLKAARDELGLSSRDLFQCFDITDSTTEGLQRAVLTILALERGAPSSKSRRSGMYLQPRPTSLQRLNSADLASRSSLDISFDSAPADSPSGSPARNGSVRSSSRLSVQQQRKEAERILVSGPQTEGTHDDNASAKSRRRRSVEAQSSSYHRSITFADSVSNDDYFASGRLPYRDRKLSESAVSLTEVAEEEPEEIMNSPMPPRHPSPPISEIHTAPKSAPLPIPSAAPPMARSSSQRRISMELSLGSANASTENLEELRAASPVRHTPLRRHSGVSRPTPSLLNPSRDLPASPSVIGGGASLPSPRLPFPRSASVTNDSPSAKRLHRHLSLSGTTSASEASLAANAISASSPKLAPQRPPHHRFSSEFSSGYRVPLSPTTAKSDSQSPGLAFPRPRYDSEVTLGYNSTLASVSTSEESPHLSRSNSQTPAPRHKLVVSEPGETPVTYVSDLALVFLYSCPDAFPRCSKSEIALERANSGRSIEL